jgi:hypothetical protein
VFENQNLLTPAIAYGGVILGLEEGGVLTFTGFLLLPSTGITGTRSERAPVSVA